jgi:hypothetical protein
VEYLDFQLHQGCQQTALRWPAVAYQVVCVENVQVTKLLLDEVVLGTVGEMLAEVAMKLFVQCQRLPGVGIVIAWWRRRRTALCELEGTTEEAIQTASCTVDSESGSKSQAQFELGALALATEIPRQDFVRWD